MDLIEFLEIYWYVYLALFKVRPKIVLKVTRNPCKLPTDVQKVLLSLIV
jgi:hypothetical protein